MRRFVTYSATAGKSVPFTRSWPVKAQRGGRVSTTSECRACAAARLAWSLMAATGRGGPDLTHGDPCVTGSGEVKEVSWPSASVARRSSTATSTTTQKSRVSRSHDGRGTTRRGPGSSEESAVGAVTTRVTAAPAAANRSSRQRIVGVPGIRVPGTLPQPRLPASRAAPEAPAGASPLRPRCSARPQRAFLRVSGELLRHPGDKALPGAQRHGGAGGQRAGREHNIAGRLRQGHGLAGEVGGDHKPA